MPLSTLYDATTRLIRIIGEGVVSMEDRSHTVGQILANSEYSGASDILIDVSRVTNAPDGDQFSAVARLVQLLLSRFSGRVGIVNAQAGHLTISQLVALSADFSRDSVRAFYSEGEALAWFKQ